MPATSSPLQNSYACWVKRVFSETHIIDRKYVLRLDGSIITRLDRIGFKDHRLLPGQDFNWEPYKPKKAFYSVSALEKAMAQDLESKGYTRQF